MKEYVLRFNETDQNFIDITSVYPEPVEAFAFIPKENGKIEISTRNEDRFNQWVNKLKQAKREFEKVQA